MGSVDAIDQMAALSLVRRTCGASDANGNHRNVALLARALLVSRLAGQVSVLTTNYDTCLDSALEDGIGKGVVAFRRHGVIGSEYHGGKLKYVKLHGCIRTPKSLVFTFRQMLRLMASDKWKKRLVGWLCGGVQQPTVAMSIGYGFWDPDLRPLIAELLGAARLFRFERESFYGDHVESANQHLRQELFDTLSGTIRGAPRLQIVKASLVSALAEQNALGQLYSALGSKDVPCLSPQVSSRAIPADEITRCFRRWSDAEIVSFVGRLLNACNRAYGRELFGAELEKRGRQNSGRAVDIAHAYFRTFGMRNEWEAGARAALKFSSREYSSSVRAVSLAVATFMLTLSAEDKIVAGLRAGKLLVCASALGLLGRKEARAQVSAYGMHFVVKGAEVLGLKLAQRAPRFLLVVKLLVGFIRSALLLQLRVVSASGDADTYGDVTALEVECRILSGRRAVEAAQQSRLFRTAIGRTSNGIQAFRLVCWAFACEGRMSDAAAAACQGFKLSLLLPEEPSLARKLGANFVRILSESQAGLLDVDPVGHSNDDLIEACAIFLAGGPGLVEASTVIAEGVFHSFGPRVGDLRSEIRELPSAETWAIYLPTCEPQ